VLSATDATPLLPERPKSGARRAVSHRLRGHGGRVSGYCAPMEHAAVESHDPDTVAIAVPGIAVDDELLVEEISIDGMCGVY